MNKTFRKILIMLLASLMLLSSVNVFADETTDMLIDIQSAKDIAAPPTGLSEATILIEANSGAILYSSNADTAYYPASITKIMTALVVLEKCKLDDIVTFSYRATHELEDNSSGIARTEGEQMSVRECLYAMLVASANEVAQALAEHAAGSIESFADLMNEKATAIGCTNTHFTNPSGLNDSNHYTTCHDMALILREAIKNPDFVDICSTTTHVVPATNKHNETLNISMSHPLLIGPNKYKYAVCGKTGYTMLAGFTLATYATKNGMDLICIVLHAGSDNERCVTSRNLFEYGFNNFTLHGMDEINALTGNTLSDSGAFLSSNVLSLSVDKDSAIILPNGVSLSSLEAKAVLNSNSGNGNIGRIIYKMDGQPVGQASLVMNADTEDPYAFLAVSSEGDAEAPDESGMKTARKVFLAAIIIVIGIVIIGFLAYRFINGNSRNRKKRKSSIKKKSFRF